MKLIRQIEENGIVAVIRGAKEESILDIAKALSDGGVKTLEITMETPKVLSVIEKLVDTLPDDVIVGAGTVLDAETARAAILSGAQFIFSPTVDTDMIRITKRYGVVSIPGAMTPTEILTAYEHGGDIIKVFPANVLGPNYLKDVHGPLPHIPLMPTGGISLDNVGEYIRKGAVAAGVGSTLVSAKEEVNDQYLQQVREKAARFVDEVRKARSAQ